MSMIGTQILNYKITEIIGEGGMAKVYKARHTTFRNKQVAIKILDPQLAAKTNIKERFIHEAHIMAELDHANIVQVFDFFIDEKKNIYAIIMELLDGESLSDFIKKNGALSEQLTYDLMVKILNAFDYAHAKGLIHRDVKPANIYITKNKSIKILDFGIAKLLDTNQELTSTGMIMGTPMYMSPEQVKDSKHIDHRSDIYSLGVLMYFMLTGKPPYKTGYEITYKIVTESLPELLTYPQLNIIIQKATAKNPNDRYENCYSFLIDLQKTTINNGKQNKKEIHVKQRTSNKDYKKKYTRWIVLLSILYIGTITTGIFVYSKNLNKLKIKNSIIEKVKKKKDPIVITDIKLGNTNYDGDIIDNYGSKLYVNRLQYLSPKIEYIAMSNKQIELTVKIFGPDRLVQSHVISNYTYSREIYVHSTKTSSIVGGWGSDEAGTYDCGKYMIEIWYDDRRLFSKHFHLYCFYLY